jgi:hypothetical protein
VTRPPFDPAARDDAPLVFDHSGQRLTAQPADEKALRTATAPIVHLAAGLGVVAGMLGMTLVAIIAKVVTL